MPERLDAHCRMIVRKMAGGYVVPFLGAGVNACGRPKDESWEGRYLPTGAELAQHLATSHDFPYAESAKDLVRVSQYVAVMEGEGPLYGDLRSVFDADYPPTPLHEFLATFPNVLREKGLPERYQLIVTTNYDDALERSFDIAGEPFDLVWYDADGPYRGKFLHRPPQGDPRPIEVPNEYADLSLDERTVILKIHGAVDRVTRQLDSYVITEDHYIDFLTHTDVETLFPVTLLPKLQECHFLFLGYRMQDWNLRVILHRIWGERRLGWESWAVRLDPMEFERRLWSRRRVDILQVSLEEYVEALGDQLQQLPPAEPRA